MKMKIFKSLLLSINTTVFNDIAFSQRSAIKYVNPFAKPDNPGIATLMHRKLPAPDSLEVYRNNSVLTISLNRPAVMNAIDIEMGEALLQHLRMAAADTTIRVVVITGRGQAFCTGGDLKFAVEANPKQPGDSFLALTSILHDCIELIRTMAKPVVAAINGPAAGAGLFLALACDLPIMAKSAYLKVSNTSYGLSLPAGGTFLLPRLVGMGRAMEMAILDQPIDARQAQSNGLVTKVVADKLFHSQTEIFAYQLSQKAVNTLGRVKQLMNESFNRNLKEQLATEQQAIVKSANHPEGREGLAAFLQKRRPNFSELSLTLTDQ